MKITYWVAFSSHQIAFSLIDEKWNMTEDVVFTLTQADCLFHSLDYGFYRWNAMKYEIKLN